MKYIVLCLMLAACAPDVVSMPSPINVPVGIPCRLKAVPIPVWSTDGITDKSSMFEKVRAILATNEQHKAYEESLAAGNTACQ